MLTTKQLAKLAFQDILAAFQRGELARKDWWTLMKGAEKYRRAVAAGDVVEETVGAIRAELHCANCPSRTDGKPVVMDGHKFVASYCGPIGQDRTEAVIPTCGCGVMVTIDGEILPAAKTMVKSAQCDQRRW